jgi:hypothetical protein
MNGKRIFRKPWFFASAVVWEVAFVSIVIAAVVEGALTTGGGGMIA